MEEKIIKKKNDKGKKTLQKNIKTQITILIFGLFLFIVALVIANKTGIMTPWEKNKQKEDAVAAEDEKKYYDIMLNKDYYRNGWIAYKNDVYYCIRDVYAYKKEKIGDRLLDINETNIEMEDGVYTYHVKDGSKYKFREKGGLFAIVGSSDMIAFKPESDDEYVYEDPPYYYNDYGIFVKESIASEYENVKDFIKKDNISEIIFLDKKMNVYYSSSDLSAIGDMQKSISIFSEKWDEESDMKNPEKYKPTRVQVIDSNGLFYEYFDCRYSVDRKKLYIMTDRTDDGVVNGICFSIDIG